MLRNKLETEKGWVGWEDGGVDERDLLFGQSITKRV